LNDIGIEINKTVVLAMNRIASWLEEDAPEPKAKKKINERTK
jgi:hypothetical protein